MLDTRDEEMEEGVELRVLTLNCWGLGFGISKEQHCNICGRSLHTADADSEKQLGLIFLINLYPVVGRILCYC